MQRQLHTIADIEKFRGKTERAAATCSSVDVAHTEQTKTMLGTIISDCGKNHQQRYIIGWMV
jgi:hypothetical protein